MTKDCDARRAAMRQLMDNAGLTARDVARILHLSVDTVKSWSRSQDPTAPPLMAIELLAIKTSQPPPPIVPR